MLYNRFLSVYNETKIPELPEYTKPRLVAWIKIYWLIFKRSLITGESYQEIITRKLEEFREQVILANYRVKRKLESGEQDINAN